MIFNNLLTLSILLFFYLTVSYAQKAVTADIKGRQIHGITKTVDGKNVNEFLGIPYAQPPIGELRFRKPVSLTHPLDSFNATQWPNPCIQPPFPAFTFLNNNFSEDCLYLNIWSPTRIATIESKALKPVMVFIHGGALTMGSSARPFINGDILTTKGDVVLVTFNYRLGTFGFFYSGTDDAPGNVGLWDQALALQWVNDNIKYFGGDPNKITIFGVSAGSWSVSLHLLSPITRNMYQNAIMMSGAVVSSELIDDRMHSKTKWLNGAKLIGCNDNSTVNEITPKMLNCLRTIDANSLLEMIDFKEVNEGTLFGVYPVTDGVFIPHSPKQLLESGQFKTGANILIGTVEDEASFILPLRVDYLKFHPTSPQNLTYAEAYQELLRITKSNYSRVRINGEDMANVYFTEMSPNSVDYDRLRRTIGIAIGDYYISCPAIHFGRKLFANDMKNSNVYQYYYNNKIVDTIFCTKWMGACHGDDEEPVFGIPFQNRNNSLDAQRDESAKVIEFFTHFAKHGYPSPQNSKDWPKYYAINDDIIAPYFDLKNNNFRNGLKDIECESLFKSYLEQ